MKSFFGEFKEFISRGNVIDMAVGIVVGNAFTKIINSFVSDIIMPAIGALTGKINLTALKLVISPAAENSAELALTYGNFIQAMIDFLIIAFSVFCAVKIINSLRARLEKKKDEEPASEPTPSNEELLLCEIRDLLKNK